eukprot:Protomagalhaensia_sp_Gyna_25__2298@NODE_2259_length_1186_cov_98_297297_g1873_i0_p1_GENE_NODE_2259_length_1186_cov_98_297297_g1873_i0NODE_2259_length_1186_cov_98_297297_g1873_i0_p1_ORF_typecomplete_len121_score4_65EMP24_GP25L/PF01105_24/0_0013_NODE_2259_length_1186_cov_98_297297_g1873_i0442804
MMLGIAVILTWGVFAIRTKLFPHEEECIGWTARLGTEVLFNFEAHPLDDSRVKVNITKQQFALGTRNVLSGPTYVRAVPPWSTGHLNLTADLYNEQDSHLTLCFSNVHHQKKAEITFTIR